MQLKKILKKIPYYLSLTLLTSGASLILGFLSFGGTFALWPILPLAFAAFALSVSYEGEIYLQNIKSALNKLFKYNFLQRGLAKDYLLENFPNTAAEDCPQFFKDYETQLHLISQFGHKRLDKESAAQKKGIEKTLRDMEKWFAAQLFRAGEGDTEYERDLQQWLAQHDQATCQAQFANLHAKFQKVKIFSTLAGLFMGTGTTYLLVEAFSAMPAMAAIPFASWPLMIVPMAAIAGAAYALLTYNAVTDMIRNNTLSKWYAKIRDDLRGGWTLRNVGMAITAVILLALAVALTICTAGTWWTVVKETRPLFTWMVKLPRFVLGVIHPLITGISSLVFNLQNTSESLKLIDSATRSKVSLWTRMVKSVQEGATWLQKNENWFQIINPFRLILKVTITPLRILLFLGHLLSIGVTTDRVPGVSQIFSALLGIISEGFEDAHYFVGHDHSDDGDCDQEHTHAHTHDHNHQHEPGEKAARTLALLEKRLGEDHGHHHNVDIPTWFIKLIFSPVYFLAASWDYMASQLNTTKSALSFSRAWEKQTGVQEEHHKTVDQQTAQPSSAWKIQQAIFRIERHKEKQLDGVWVGQEVASLKKAQLTSLQHDLAHLDLNDREALPTRLSTESTKKIYNQHRWFAQQGPTATENFLQELPERINALA
jgi:hypothetical protein